jgi:hypothetical protein
MKIFIVADIEGAVFVGYSGRPSWPIFHRPHLPLPSAKIYPAPAPLPVSSSLIWFVAQRLLKSNGNRQPSVRPVSQAFSGAAQVDGDFQIAAAPDQGHQPARFPLIVGSVDFSDDFSSDLDPQ